MVSPVSLFLTVMTGSRWYLPLDSLCLGARLLGGEGGVGGSYLPSVNLSPEDLCTDLIRFEILG